MRLCNLRQDHDPVDEPHRTDLPQDFTKPLRAIADSLGILERADLAFGDLVSQPGIIRGTEHVVELDPASSRVAKITVPPAFGLVPVIRQEPVIDLRSTNQRVLRQTLELGNAGPLHYLERWRAANLFLGDNVRLTSVIEWTDKSLSFGITQPHYHGTPASQDEIRRFFTEAGWEDLSIRAGRSLFYHFGFNLIAVDAEPRNCFIHAGNILPFDVIFAHPDPEIANFLGLHPCEAAPPSD